MKKFALFLSATAIAVGASQARTLSPDEALSRLDEASASTQGMRAPKFKGAKKLVKTATFNNLPTYYVFSTPSQTIFVAYAMLRLYDLPVRQWLTRHWCRHNDSTDS